MADAPILHRPEAEDRHRRDGDVRERRLASCEPAVAITCTARNDPGSEELRRRLEGWGRGEGSRHRRTSAFFFVSACICAAAWRRPLVVSTASLWSNAAGSAPGGRAAIEPSPSRLPPSINGQQW